MRLTFCLNNIIHLIHSLVALVLLINSLVCPPDWHYNTSVVQQVNSTGVSIILELVWSCRNRWSDRCNDCINLLAELLFHFAELLQRFGLECPLLQLHISKFIHADSFD